MEYEETRLVESGEGPTLDFHNFVDCGPQASNGTKPNESRSERCITNRRCRKTRAADSIYDFIIKISTSPINKVFNTSEWVNSKFKYMNPAAFQIKNIIELIQRKYTNSTLSEIIKLHSECKKVYFSATINDFDSYYYDVERSLEIMDNIVHYQNDNDPKKVEKFLHDLYCICERVIPKKNAMLILSAPNAGKNLFFDAVIHWYSNYGQIANFNRHQQFPLMDAVNRRILVWNEPMCESTAFEDVKLLFGGDTMKVKVKYMSDAVIDRTPIIVLTNNDIFPKDPTFQCRMIKYNWKPFSELKHVKCKLNPHSFIELLKKYNIINDRGNFMYETFVPSDYTYSDISE